MRQQGCISLRAISPIAPPDCVRRGGERRFCGGEQHLLDLRGGGDGGCTSAEELLRKADALREEASGAAGAKNRRSTQSSISGCLAALIRFLFTGEFSGGEASKEGMLEEAADLYAEAGLSLKLSGDPSGAAEALMRAGDSSLAAGGMPHDAAGHYVGAAKAAREPLPHLAAKALELAADIHMRTKGAVNLALAARLHRDRADILQVMGNVTGAEEALKEAVKLFSVDGQILSADECKLRLADMLAKSGAHTRAAVAYDALADVALANSLGLGGGRSAYDLWLRSGLCRLASGNVDAVQDAISRYSEADLGFGGSSEAERLLGLRDAVVACDADAFSKEVRTHWDMGSDPVTLSLLALIRQIVNREGQAGQRLAEEMAREADEELL